MTRDGILKTLKDSALIRLMSIDGGYEMRSELDHLEYLADHVEAGTLTLQSATKYAARPVTLSTI